MGRNADDPGGSAGQVTLAVNVAFLFTEHPYLERFAAARRAGFAAVETPWPTEPLADVSGAIADAGLACVQMNADAGDLPAGERGYANDPARVDEWRAALDAALAWAAQVGCPAVNVLAGNAVAGVPPAAQHAIFRENVAWALPRARQRDVVLLLEVLNERDTPYYLYTRLEPAAAFVRAFDDAHLRLQFDAYHVALVKGDVASAFRTVAPLVGHVQLADAPGRHEPGTGAIDFGALLGEVAAAGYAGAVSLEYVPQGSTADSLAWLPRNARAGGLPTMPA